MFSRIRSGGVAVFIIAMFMVAMGSILLAPVAGLAQTLSKIKVDRVDMVGKLNGYRFDTLDSELSAAEIKAEGDPRFEMNAMAAFGAFDSGSPLMASRLNDWVQASPNSYAALIARATCLVATGQRLRGNGLAKDVPYQNWAAADKDFREAVHDADTALKIHPNLALAYALRIKAARISGAKDALSHARGEGLSMAPASFAVREQIMYALRPRWGGTREAMQALADSSQDYATQNPAMQFLKGWVSLDEGDDLADRGQWPAAVDKYTEALRTGGEYWTTYRRRANAYFAMQQWQKALEDGTRSNDLYPEYSETLKMLAFATARLREPEASILWLGDYMRYEMPEPDLFELLKADNDELKAEGKHY
jgi:tetratricopeptide (TPR) repeat protein